MTIIMPVLRRLHSPDVANLETYTPKDREHFAILVQAFFGPIHGEGEESFDILVCTADWLALEVKKKGIVVGRHHLIVHDFDFPRLCTFLCDYAKRCTGTTWQEVASKLSRIGKWEFEDYVP